MLIQLILAFIEDIIISFFIAELTNIKKNKKYFIILNTFLCCLTTHSFNYYQINQYIPFSIFFIIITLLKIFKKKITLNDVVISLFGPILVIITDFISLLVFCYIFKFTIYDLVANANLLVICSFVAKLLLLFVCLFILNKRPKTKNNLSYKKWGILCPIWLLIFSGIYILGDAIVFHSLSTISMYYLIIDLVALSILIIILYEIIQKESLNTKQFELNIQKEKYIKQNKNIMLKLHDEISVIDHNNMYTFMQIKNLLKEEKYQEIDEIINNNIHKLKKYKNIICTGNPYFDQVLNREISHYSIQGRDIKTICTISSKEFQIEKEEMDFIVDTLKYLFSISNSKKPFTIHISHKINFIIIYFMFNQSEEFDNSILTDLKKIYPSDYLTYSCFTEEELTHFKFILEMR